MDYKKYPSEITRKQFEEIREILESAKKQTKPRTIDLFEIFNACLYLLKTGCQWRMLPKEYPKWQTVHRYFTIWRMATNKNGETVLEQALKKNGWTGPKKTGAELQNEFFNSGCTKC